MFVKCIGETLSVTVAHILGICPQIDNVIALIRSCLLQVRRRSLRACYDSTKPEGSEITGKHDQVPYR